MKTIHKFPLSVDDTVTIAMPAGAQILSVQVQRGTPCLWALVSPFDFIDNRVFRIYGTGQPIDDKADGFLGTHTFVGTIQLDDLVFHVFEVT
jgi:hypothetical protein